MKTKEDKIKTILKIIISVSFIFLVAVNMIIIFNLNIALNKSYAKESDIETEEDINISNANEIDIDKIIEENTNNTQVEQIQVKEEILEYLTQYRTNKDIPQGISYVIQEGREGKQEIAFKVVYNEEGEVVSENLVSTKVIKSSFNKIVEIGGANYTSNYKVKKGDDVYVTSDTLGFMSEASEDSRKITTLKTDDQLKVLEITQNWYKVAYKNSEGWVKTECTTYINKNDNNQNEQGDAKTKQQLLSSLSYSMQLNKPSGLTLEQFKKVLSDDKDKNKIFINNAEYFYYVEKQYNINGVFLAAVGIHESNWGTSEIALKKYNLFGYGAYDSNPYNGAYKFSNYSESIDLLARVFVKYYLNPSGTSIYGGEKAEGTYYNGATLTGVNAKYATDKNWANAVYTHMKYLYNKL